HCFGLHTLQRPLELCRAGDNGDAVSHLENDHIITLRLDGFLDHPFRRRTRPLSDIEGGSDFYIAVRQELIRATRPHTAQCRPQRAGQGGICDRTSGELESDAVCHEDLLEISCLHEATGGWRVSRAGAEMAAFELL